jgi:hypothetical protein
VTVGSFAPTNSFFVVLSASTRHLKKNPTQLQQVLDPKTMPLSSAEFHPAYLVAAQNYARVPQPPTVLSPMAVALSIENMRIVSTCA